LKSDEMTVDGKWNQKEEESFSDRMKMNFHEE
jgi:hypothetical protein